MELGDRVLRSDGCARALTLIKHEELSEKAPVVEITFEPDVPVAAVEMPVSILTQGSRKKPLRRSGMHKGRQRMSGVDAASIPDTEGEYQD